MQFAATPEEVRAVTDAALADADALVATAVATGGAGTFEAVLLPLDEADARLSAAYGAGAFMARVHGDRAVRDAGQDAEERMDRWRVDLPYREDLAAVIHAFAAGGAYAAPGSPLPGWLAAAGRWVGLGADDAVTGPLPSGRPRPSRPAARSAPACPARASSLAAPCPDLQPRPGKGPGQVRETG